MRAFDDQSAAEEFVSRWAAGLRKMSYDISENRLLQEFPRKNKSARLGSTRLHHYLDAVALGVGGEEGWLCAWRRDVVVAVAELAVGEDDNADGQCCMG